MLTKKDIFNNKLSRAQKFVDYALGVENAKFRIFEEHIRCKEETFNLSVRKSVVPHHIREG